MENLYYRLLPPCNRIAEEILLGSLIIHPDKFNNVLQDIEIEYFFIESHQIIYRTLVSIHKTTSINVIHLIHSLKKTKTLTYIGGIQRILELIKKSQIFVSSMNIAFYIQELMHSIHYYYYKRLLIQYGYNIIQLAYTQDLSSKEIYIKISKYIKHINQETPAKKLDNFQYLITDLIHSIKYNKNHTDQDNEFITSGFRKLDEITHGLPKGDLIVVAGRPSTGKTSFVINIAYHLMLNIDIIIFSLEMTKIQILYKLISIGSSLPIQQILKGKINIYQWNLVQHICNKLLQSEIYINDNPTIHIDSIKSISQLILKQKNNKAIIIIDYLQLIKTIHFNSDNRQQELTYITRELKLIAQNLSVPILMLSQLNRSIEKRVNKKPVLSDLKESGCLNYKLSLNIDNKNKLQIAQIINYKTQMYLKYFSGSIKTYYSKQRIRNNFIQHVYILNSYVFLPYINSDSILKVTHNHKLLARKYWCCQDKVQENDQIIKAQNIYLKEKVFIKKIIFLDYSLVYDIAKYRYLNLVCNDLILHNSIEQDADIVIMLYNDDIESKQNADTKMLDIIVSKNRNGPVGSFQLIFHKRNTFFENPHNILL